MAVRDSSLWFAKLLPANTEAKLLFNDCIEYMEDREDGMHLMFVQKLTLEEAAASEGQGRTTTDDSSSEHDCAVLTSFSDSSTESTRQYGHFVFLSRSPCDPSIP